MDYARHYGLIVERARMRTLECYSERHHVIPKCMGGDNSDENLVSLTAEEHYVAHQLLMKIHPGNKKLVYAAWAMTHGKTRSNKKYGWLKRKRAEAQRGVRHTDAARRKISEKAKGRTLTPERANSLKETRLGKKNSEDHNRKVSEALKGKKKTAEHKAAIAESRKSVVFSPEMRERLAANRGKKLSEHQKAALLAANLGRPQTAEHRAKVSAAKKGKMQPVVQCPHCEKTGGESLMRRWHFDNCRSQHG